MLIGQIGYIIHMYQRYRLNSLDSLGRPILCLRSPGMPGIQAWRA